MSALIPGYNADNYRAVWERQMFWGAPRGWAVGWLCVCLYAGLAVLNLAPKRLGWVLALWLCGQGALIGLTQIDKEWDRLAWRTLKQILTGKLHDYYEAG